MISPLVVVTGAQEKNSPWCSHVVIIALAPQGFRSAQDEHGGMEPQGGVAKITALNHSPGRYIAFAPPFPLHVQRHLVGALAAKALHVHISKTAAATRVQQL